MPERTATTIDAETVRREHFERLLNHLEAEGPDGSVPGSTSIPVRYAVLTESDRGHGRFLTYAADMNRIQEVAAANIHEGWQPVAYFDLDTLSGPEPLPEVVDYEGKEWDVIGARVIDDQRIWNLRRSPEDQRRRSYDWENVDPDDVDLLGWTDDRLPTRYDVAGVNLAVAFNTIPTER